jgi:IS1 family transposase
MQFKAIVCPSCQSLDIVKHGVSGEGKDRYIRTRIKRLARKTICFSKSIRMHDIVIGLFINRFEFGCAI